MLLGEALRKGRENRGVAPSALCTQFAEERMTATVQNGTRLKMMHLANCTRYVRTALRRNFGSICRRKGREVNNCRQEPTQYIKSASA